MSNNDNKKASIKDYSEEVVRLLAHHCSEKTTGKISIVFDLKDGGIGRATATVERALKS